MRKLSRLALVILCILVLSGCDAADLAVTNINRTRNSKLVTVNQNINQSAVLGEKIENTETDEPVVAETVAGDTTEATPAPVPSLVPVTSATPTPASTPPPAPVVVPLPAPIVAPVPTVVPALAPVDEPVPEPVVVPPPPPAPEPAPAPVVVSPPAPTTNTNYCCKHCSTGKACGDSCISRSYTCHQPPGCACDY